MKSGEKFWKCCPFQKFPFGTAKNYHPIKCIVLIYMYYNPLPNSVLNSRAVQEQFLKFSKHS